MQDVIKSVYISTQINKSDHFVYLFTSWCILSRSAEKTNEINTYVISANIRIGVWELGLLDGSEDGEYNSVVHWERMKLIDWVEL